MKNRLTFLLVIFLSSLSMFSQEVTVFRTSPEGSERLTPQNAFDLNEYALGNPNFTIQESQVKQTMEGFGFTLTNASAELFMSMNSTKRSELLNEIFNPITGINSSMVRIPVGACDLASSLYTYNDNAGDSDMSEFNFGPDANHLIPILKQIKAINPNIKLLATPWSAPLWMKTNNRFGKVEWIGGTLRNDMRSTYALYLKTYLEKMNAEGLKVWGLSVQNEPGNVNNYPSMTMTASQQVDFIDNYLYQAIKDLSFGAPKILGHDHNCYATDWSQSAAEGLQFALDVGNNSTHVDGLAFHLYDQNHVIESMSTAYNQTGKEVYFTEQITNEGFSGQDFNSNFGFHMEKVVLGSVQNWSKSVFAWNMAHDLGNYHNRYQPGPTTNPDVCRTCVGAVEVDGSNYYKKAGYYIIGQIAKFVDPGAVVLNITGSGSDDYKYKAAFANPDGTKVLIFWNNNSGYNRDITVNIGNGRSFSYSIPKRSAITFKWNDGTPIVPEPPTNLTATSEAGKISLNWALSDGATSYDVLRATSNSGPYTVIKSDLVNVAYSDGTAAENQIYYYKVRAKNSVGTSGDSQVAFATVIPFMQLIPNGNYRISSDVHSELITAPSNATSNAYMATNNNDDKQLWTVTHLNNDIYTIKNVSTGKYMGIKDNWCGILGEVVPNSSVSDNNIEFKIVDVGNNRVSFQIAFTTCNYGSENIPVKAWDIENGAVGANVRTYDWDGTNANQQFEFVGLTVGFNDINVSENQISIFPSPSNGDLTLLSNEAGNLEGSVSVVDMSGRILKTFEISEGSKSFNINIKDLNNGIYFLQILHENQLITKKFVLSKM